MLTFENADPLGEEIQFILGLTPLGTSGAPFDLTINVKNPDTDFIMMPGGSYGTHFLSKQPNRYVKLRFTPDPRSGKQTSFVYRIKATNNIWCILGFKMVKSVDECLDKFIKLFKYEDGGLEDSRHIPRE